MKLRLAVGQSGFSLLEILVAFSILAVSLGVLLEIFGRNTRAASYADEYTRAITLAESRLAEVGTEEPLEEGERFGKTDGGYRWRVSTQPYQPAEEDVSFDGLPVLPFRVDVEVDWGEGRDHRSVILSTLRLSSRR